MSLTDGLRSPSAGRFGTNLGSGNLAAEDDLMLMAAITATLAGQRVAIITLPRSPAISRLRGRSEISLESVRRVQAGLHSFLSMRRIEARRKNASAFRLRFSQ